MIIRMFLPRFHPQILSGEKDQTIYKLPKTTPKVGDKISLRAWSGRPYHSKQIVLRESTINEVYSVYIGHGFVSVADKNNYIIEDHYFGFGETIEGFAKRDGFKSSHDLIGFFNKVYGIPFRGILIRWDVNEKNDRD